MAYNETLAALVREALRSRRDMTEKATFGGVTFMIAGNMCCGVHRSDLILRLDPHTTATDLRSPHVRAWDFMKKPMPGMFAVEEAGCTNQKAVEKWVELALKHCLSLPPKISGMKRRRATTSKKVRS